MSESKAVETESKKDVKVEAIDEEGRITESKELPEYLKPKFKEIREEAKSWRLKAQENEKKLQALEAKEQEAVEKKMKEEGKLKELLEAKEKALSEKESLLKKTLIDNELRFIAKEEGMKDLDGLKLLTEEELKSIQVEGQTVKNVKEIIEALKERKPYFFGDNITTVSVDASRPSKGQAQTLKSFTREQIKDPEFFAEHREEIMKAMNQGRIK